MSVYTTIERDVLEDFLESYSVGELVDYCGISEGIENTNYFVDTRQHGQLRRFVLTLFEHHDIDEMQYYLGLMHHLAYHHVPSADPVADDNGDYLRMLRNRPAALVRRLQGDSIHETTLSHCEQMGAAMGKMHTAGLSYDKHQPNPRGPAWCAETARKVHDRLGADDQVLLDAEVDFQRSNRDADIPRGVVHADMFRDNVLWNNGTLSGLIDFYYACDDILLYDVAITVNDWCRSGDRSLDRAKVHSFLRHYHRHRPLLPEEQQYWTTMLRAGALRFWLSRLYDLHFPREGELVHTKNPDEFRDILADRVEHQNSYLDYWI